MAPIVPGVTVAAVGNSVPLPVVEVAVGGLLLFMILSWLWYRRK